MVTNMHTPETPKGFRDKETQLELQVSYIVKDLATTVRWRTASSQANNDSHDAYWTLPSPGYKSVQDQYPLHQMSMIISSHFEKVRAKKRPSAIAHFQRCYYPLQRCWVKCHGSTAYFPGGRIDEICVAETCTRRRNPAPSCCLAVVAAGCEASVWNATRRVV